MLKQGILSWTPARLKAAPADEDDEDGEGAEKWQRVSGRVWVATLRSLFRISERDGVGAGDSGCLVLGGRKVCALSIGHDDPADGGEDDERGAGGLGGVGTGDEAEADQGQALRVAVDLKITRERIGGMSAAVLRSALVEEMGLVGAGASL